MTAVLIPRRRSRPTLADIAADASVSRATVSLVIRNVPTVADGTRQRVMSSLRRLGYVYNRGAASLRSQRSHSVGLVVSDITNPSTFGVINADAGPRVMQFSLRFDF